MKVSVLSVSDLGLALRAVRRNSGVRLDDFAAAAGVSKQFVSDVERGKPGVRLALVLKLLAELGIPMTLDVPTAAEAELEALRVSRPGPARRRASPANPSTPLNEH